MPDLSAVIRPGDRAILEELAKRGDALTEPRHVIVFFFRFEDDARSAEAVCNPLAQRLISLGWTVSGLEADAVIVESERRVDPDSVNDMAEIMEAVAHEFGVDFDGWECALVAQGRA
jgi:hypothetical protein